MRETLPKTPTSARILVLLNTDPEVLAHGDHPGQTIEKYQAIADRSHGRIIAVGAPVKPENNWNCGTDMVWPVVDDAILRETGRLHLKGKVFVCRHQIIVGD